MIKEKLGMWIVLYFFNEHPTLNPKGKLKHTKGVLFFHSGPQSLNTIFLSDIEETA